MPHRSERFAVHSYEVDAFGELTLPALAGYLQDIAGRHAADLGCGLDALRARGVTWVLLRQRVEVPSAIRLGDALEVTTWPSGVHGLVASREFRIARAGAEVGRASTAWLVLDLASRRPVRPTEVLDPALRPQAEPVAPIARALPAPGPESAARRLDIRYADIDLNRHVTNTSYVGWALESVPEAVWAGARAVEVEAHYLAEARLGEVVVARCAAADDGWRLHAILREGDGKELARLRTRWFERATRPLAAP